LKLSIRHADKKRVVSFVFLLFAVAFAFWGRA
jgi:hypothetical protein